jgi:lysophospholipid acyltransferase (LPLAT)-like uncharacterized protein
MSPPSQNTISTAAKPKSGGSVVPHAPTFLQRTAAWLVWALIRTCTATLRFRIQDGSGFYDGSNPGPIIYCVWHNRLATCLSGYYSYARKRNRTLGMAAIVSASKDGGFLTAILERFGVQPVRGSSSRRGPQAMRELITWAEQGWDLAITPDGPRGPRYKIQQGVMSLAQLTGRPILPAAYNLAWKITLKSWDRFQIPLPFSRCEAIIGQPVWVPREATDEQREMLRQSLEQTLSAINRD